MAEKVWRGLLEVTQSNRVSSDRVLIEQLSRALVELDLPAPFLERLQTGVAEAIRRAWQPDRDRVVHLTVAALVLELVGGQLA